MITLAQLIERIRIVAATEPDFIYPATTCTYLPNKEVSCGCIVGEALVDLGVDKNLLALIDGWAPQGISVSWGADPMIEALSEVVEYDALRSPWVAAVQAEQDSFTAWGAAIRQADSLAATNGWVMA